MRRFRVRAMSKDYGDLGPDLLRTKDNATRQLGSMLGKQPDGYHVRRNPPGEREDWSSWAGPKRRVEVMQAVSAFTKSAPVGAKLQVGRKSGGNVNAYQEVWVIAVHDLNLANVNTGAEAVASLAHAHFDGLQIAGFSCREYNGIPGSGWSDHAWGDAVDMWGPSNDKLTDWCARMGRENLMLGCDQFIGSKDDRVYSMYEPSYSYIPGGPASHLTHVHASFRQHFGRDPNCR
jgi:hypothetical protein